MTTSLHENSPLKVLLVDDHTLFRESLRRVLESDLRFCVVADVPTVSQALEFCTPSFECDLALIDFQLSDSGRDGNGLTVLRRLRASHPKIATILLTAGAGREDIKEAVRLLQTSVFLKSEPMAELLVAIDRTLQGDVWLSSSVAVMLSDTPEAKRISEREIAFNKREMMILRWITEGLSNKQIGAELSVSESSVKALLQGLFEKTAVRTRAQLVRYVFESNLELP